VDEKWLAAGENAHGRASFFPAHERERIPRQSLGKQGKSQGKAGKNARIGG
jgi:hypothetical protein